jgi:long-chain acyl-CoA synthetase
MSQIRTLGELVFVCLPKNDKPDCLMAKKEGIYRGIPSAEVIQSVEALAATLIQCGVQKGDRVGILAENRPEWAYADLAIICAGALTVPIYCTLPAKQIEYIIHDSEMGILFVSSDVQLKKILEIRDTTPGLRKIVIFDPIDVLPPDVDSLDACLKRGTEILKSNANIVKERNAANKPEDVFTIVYTSGTTGEPKGVMLTHSNIISNIEAISTGFCFTPQDRALSFLPLCHILERMAGYYTLLYHGATIAYAESLEQMPKNLAEVQPTVLMSVPRVYEKFYNRITDGIAAKTGFERRLAIWALKIADAYSEAKLANQSPNGVLELKYKIADLLVLKKIRGRLGGKLRLVVSGGAALPRQLGRFFYGIGLTILEGYGLTETSPVIAVNRPDGFKFGTVGPPVPGVEVKIAADGEILTRGPHIMKGYYNKPKETSEVIDTDGWFHTGDIGEIDADRFLCITDRKKDLIVTSAGKNIAPQFVENTLKSCKYVAQIVVVGDKRKFPSALIVPNLDNLKKFANAGKIAESDLLTDRTVLSEIQKEIDRLSTNLAPFERVKKIALLPKEFTIESGELTPSLKVKRRVVEKKYKDVIDSLYSEQIMT